jgi:hypothetical protein
MKELTKKISIAVICLTAIFVMGANSASAADPLLQGRELTRQGRYEAAAMFFNRYALAHPNDKKLTPEALDETARLLDAMTDRISGKAEKHCYWRRGARRTPSCMQDEVKKLNAIFGAGAFRYEHAVTYILYTGVQYKEILKRFPKSKYASEAKFFLMIHSLIGHPDNVLPKVKSFCKAKAMKGKWKDTCSLLWARVNEDTWYVHRKWSWVLYNQRIAPEELLIRSEPYRQEALKTYSRLKKKRGFVGQAAKREHDLLKQNKESSATYSIVNDSDPGTLADWGIGSLRVPPGNGAQLEGGSVYRLARHWQ